MKILDIPFDETTHSPIAYDYAQFQRHMKNYGAEFVTGQIGRAASFDGTNYGKVNMSTIMPNNSPYTILFWHKSSAVAPYVAPDEIAFLALYSNDVIETVPIQTDINVWNHYAIAFNDSFIKVYVNGVLESTTLTSNGFPVEWVIQQETTYAGNGGFPYEFPITFGEPTANYALRDIDQLLLYNVILSENDIILAATQHPERRVFYYINERPFDLDFDVYVSDSHGLIDALSLKENVKVDWRDEHGILIDLERRRFNEREIKLDCFIRCNGFLDFSMKVNEFMNEFTKQGSHRLRVDIDDYKQLVYEVYMPSGSDLNKRWRETEFFGTFTLTLREAEPVKRILYFDAGIGGNVVKINMQGSYHPYNIYWGDGTFEKDLDFSQSQLISHAYSDTTRKYFIIITGDIEGITSFAHNAILTWSQL